MLTDVLAKPVVTSPPNRRITSFKGQYRWLSNFWPCEVVFDGQVYPTVEHAYQAAKFPHDPDWQEVIRMAGTPGEAKRASRSPQHRTRSDWHEVQLETMAQLLRQKFSKEPLRSKLLATEGTELIEGNTWGDTFWGADVVYGGQNWLGHLLMAIRAQLLQLELSGRKP